MYLTSLWDQTHTHNVYQTHVTSEVNYHLQVKKNVNNTGSVSNIVNKGYPDQLLLMTS